MTGATGVVGRAAVADLLSRGFEVHAVARRPPSADATAITWHAADLLEAGVVEELSAAVSASHLLHLAWCTEPGSYWFSSENDRWLERSVALLQGFRASGGCRSVLAGTCAEYDWSHADRPLAEFTTPLARATPYGSSKDRLREQATEMARAGGFSMAWARIFFVFGPGEHPGRLVANVASRLLRGQSTGTSKGDQRRDFLVSAEAASALGTLLEGQVEGPVNIASGQATTVREVAEMVADAAERPDLLRSGELATDAREPPLLVADVRRLREEVGWRPQLPLADAIADTVAWWRQNIRS